MHLIEELIAKNEGKTLEFKESTQSISGIIKAVIAFANTAGGTIIIGIQDRTKKIIGVTNALDEEERLTNVISDSISPFIVPNIEIRTYRKKELILIHVAHAAGPYYLKSAGIEKGVYVRFGSTNRIADTEMLEALQLFTKKISFDEIAYPQLHADALDWDAIRKCFQEIHNDITANKAENLGLVIIKGDALSPSFGGIILFGINRIKIFPDAIIRCVRFLGDNKAKVLDYADIISYPVIAFEEVIRFIERNTRMGAEIGRLKRIDIPQYPPVAIREAVINAIIHTDYAAKGASIMIAIFDDRIEITNPGGLPLGMTLDRALSGSSRVRNRVIARVFRELKLTEQWGSGIQRIITSCEEAGLQKPLFEDLDTEFRVTLFATKTHKKPLDEAHKELITLLKKKKKISTKEVAALWDIAPRNARAKLKYLADIGLIQRVGNSKKDPRSGYILT